MRKGTKAFVGVVSLGLVAAGYQAGLAAEISNGFSTTPVTNSASGATGSTAGGTSAGTSAGSETLNTPAPAAASTTKTGSAINYRYGTVQVSVTKANGKITAVNLLQAGATGGREGAFSYLVNYAIQANGSSFGNLGGATYTTDAFKQSLESALAKF